MAKETTTVIKKILPYLTRLGYSIQNDLFFEETVKKGKKVVGFTDIEIKIENKLLFLLEVKRNTQNINSKHREQALDYGKAKKVSFVSVTNGVSFELWYVKTREQFSINGEKNIFPPKNDLNKILKAILKRPKDIQITSKGQIFMPGASFNELTNVFKRCHNAIRDIEKDDEHAFSDFSKLLFLKLLEEKAINEQFDTYGFRLPYSNKFNEISKQSADSIKANIHHMFQAIQKHKEYGEVLEDDFFYIQKSKTYSKIVKELAEISFSDSDVDVKGSAFEYFLKFNLKGSQLGQYFTPREVVNLMLELSNFKSITLGLTNLKSNYVVIDPACGSGGFLIAGMQLLLKHAKDLKRDGVIDEKTLSTISKRIRKEIFYGSDAKHMLARTAKMNMIIAGDGFTNIKHSNSLTEEVDFLKISDKRIFSLSDFVFSNPPFGMSESELDSDLLELYDIPTSRGQSLFLQKMIKISKPGGIICTVIDEGILNTQSMIKIRKYIIKQCFIEAIIHLPYVTFEPNYARVSTSILLLKKKESELHKQEYPIFMYDLKEIGYAKSGKPKGKASNEIIIDLVKKYREFKNEYKQL